jgi:hypothetical protein
MMDNRITSMRLAMVALTIGCFLASGVPRLDAGVVLAQTAPSQQSSQPNATPASAPPPPATTSKPCPAVSSTSGTQPDCKTASKSKSKKRKSKVVYNGSTTDPEPAISPGVTTQQASQQLDTTKGLLAMTDENLKIVASRQLNAEQQDTVNQIKIYVEQSKAASKNGDLQRAYTLANKARMLSGDLVKH